MHQVRTSHIQHLIRNGMILATAVDGAWQGEQVHVGASHRADGWDAELPPEHVLGKAAADLRHAAEELEAERLSCLGWEQV